MFIKSNLLLALATRSRGYTNKTPSGSPVACGGKPSRSAGLTAYAG